jgi:hypothetical protein
MQLRRVSQNLDSIWNVREGGRGKGRRERRGRHELGQFLVGRYVGQVVTQGKQVRPPRKQASTSTPPVPKSSATVSSICLEPPRASVLAQRGDAGEN